jgi:hypothetical protein
MSVFEKHAILGRIGPYFNFLILPKDEQVRAIDHMSYLSELWTAVRQFDHATRLFDFCDREKPDETEWKMIAAKDGVWSISNLGFAMQYFRAGVGAVPTLNNLIDHLALRRSQKLFDSWFPNFPLMRHALAHVPESTMDDESRKKNYYQGPFVSDGMIVDGAKTQIMIKNSLKGRVYQTTFSGRLLTYEVSDATLEKLVRVKDMFFAGFQRVEELSAKTPNSRPFGQT